MANCKIKEREYRIKKKNRMGKGVQKAISMGKDTSSTSDRATTLEGGKGKTLQKRNLDQKKIKGGRIMGPTKYYTKAHNMPWAKKRPKRVSSKTGN